MCLRKKAGILTRLLSLFMCVRSTTRELATVEHPLWITKVHCCSTDTSEALFLWITSKIRKISLGNLIN